MVNKRIYLAGPDVFFPDYAHRSTRYKNLCVNLQLEALLPVDSQPCPGEIIYRGNIGLISAADGVVANLDPFRGAEVDTGTAFEVGFAVASGKPVVGYVSHAGDLLARVRSIWGPVLQNANGYFADRDGNLVENFGYHVNLMIAASCTIIVGDMAQALTSMKQLLDEQPPSGKTAIQ